MVKKYTKVQKKYISKEMAIQKLSVTPKDFEKLVVLSKVFPVFAEKKRCVDRVDDIYYKIDDIRKIGYSDAYVRFRKNKGYMKKKNKYISIGRLEKANNFYERDYNYVEILKEQYQSFGDCLHQVGEAVSNLYLINMLRIEDVSKAMESWESFCTEYGLVEKGFMGRKGVYCSFKVQKISVIWSIPYPADNLDEKYEIKKDLIKKIKIEPMKIGDYEEEEYEESEEKYIDPNSKEKHDVSLLNYGAKLYAMHVELVVHKLKSLIEKKRDRLFKNTKVYIAINSIRQHLEFILRCMECELVCDAEAEIVVADRVDTIREGVKYVQAQYIIDSINKGEMLDWKEYMIGKKLPPHVSPFNNMNDFIEESVLQSLSNTRKNRIENKIIDLDQTMIFSNINTNI